MLGTTTPINGEPCSHAVLVGKGNTTMEDIVIPLPGGQSVTVLGHKISRLWVRELPYADVMAKDTAWLMGGSPGTRVVGLDTEYVADKLALIQLCQGDRCLLLTVPRKPQKPNMVLQKLLDDHQLCKTGCEIWIDMLLLVGHCDLLTNYCQDLSVIYNHPTSSSRKGLFRIFQELYPGQLQLFKDKNSTSSNWYKLPLTEQQVKYVAYDAFASFACGAAAKRVNFRGQGPYWLTGLTPWERSMLVSLTATTLVLKHDQPPVVKNEFSFCHLEERKDKRKGKSEQVLVVNQIRYKNKWQYGYIGEGLTEDGTKVLLRPKYLSGKTAVLHMDRAFWSQITEILMDTSGELDPETARRRAFICEYLTAGQERIHHIRKNPFIEILFNPRGVSGATWDILSPPATSCRHFTRETPGLNPAQKDAVQQLAHGCRKVMLVQGPPGTGKTTVISHVVREWGQAKQRLTDVFLIGARSNVAVLNIALSLKKLGWKDFTLLVSDNFYREWHEGYYTHLWDHLITTEELNHNHHDMEDRRLQSPVILCTVSMMSGPKLVNVLLKGRRVTHLVVDEASQTYIGDYVPVLHVHGKALTKVAFVGDDKQLPPYGAERCSTPSVFDLRAEWPTDKVGYHFLNTSYRLQLQVCEFISFTVYGNKLLCGKRDMPDVRSPPLQWVCSSRCHSQKQGTSTQNPGEARLVMKLIRRCVQANMKDWVVITGYEAQRSLISNMLTKTELLKDEDQVFNVDSFQGREAKVVIVSLAQSQHLGFLSCPRRSNVMLTRSTECTFIVGSWPLWKEA